jgi:hypothetical protein
MGGKDAYSTGGLSLDAWVMLLYVYMSKPHKEYQTL